MVDSNGSLMFMHHICWLFCVLQCSWQWIIHFEPNTMQTTEFTKPAPQQTEHQWTNSASESHYLHEMPSPRLYFPHALRTLNNWRRVSFHKPLMQSASLLKDEVRLSWEWSVQLGKPTHQQCGLSQICQNQPQTVATVLLKWLIKRSELRTLGFTNIEATVYLLVVVIIIIILLLYLFIMTDVLSTVEIM